MQGKEAAQFKTEKPGAFVIIETKAEWNTGETLLNKFEMCKWNCVI